MTISVEGPKRDWQALERKISEGISLEQAAVDAGIPVEEVYARVTEGLKRTDDLNWQLRIIGQGSLKTSLAKLTKLANGGERMGKDLESTDLLAAKELARLGMQAIKLSMAGQAPREGGNGQKDLFDRREDPFDLKKIT